MSNDIKLSGVLSNEPVQGSVDDKPIITGIIDAKSSGKETIKADNVRVDEESVDGSIHQDISLMATLDFSTPREYYIKPTNGIPKSDLDPEVQTLLDRVTVHEHAITSDLPAAIQQALIEAKMYTDSKVGLTPDEISIVSHDGVISVNQVSTDQIIQGAKDVYLHCGSSNDN